MDTQHSSNPSLPKALKPEEVELCVQLLESVLADRTLLATVPQEQRTKLMTAAGKVSRPDKLEMMKVAKTHRKRRLRKELLADRERISQTTIREARKATVYVPPSPQLLLGKSQEQRPRLNRPKNCYICKKEFFELHFFYDSMCDSCGDLNYAKRFQTASLEGKTALITGARLKIGYQASLMMLRAGAKVIATTRFAHDAALRYSQEKDFEDWKHRLEIHGLDLRHSPSVDIFSEYLCKTQSRLDIIINNAAQTVRRPPGFYKHLIEFESRPLGELPKPLQSMLGAYEEWKTPRLHTGIADADSWVSEVATQGAAIGITAAGFLSQIPLKNESGHEDKELFPEGKRDADLQQVDLRKMNSWRMKLADVPTPELIEVQLVNSIAPFILCSKLKSLMLRTPNRDKHIVNVSAMEGKFTRYTKTDKHPHTNMAKAALNMMTLTSAPDYVKDGIHMNAVDTGWVTDEDPVQLSLRKQDEHGFEPPLDIVDGAARVCDPFFSGLLTGQHVWGQFLKDYTSTSW